MGFPQLDLKSEKGPKAVIKTNRGDITVQLFPELDPNTFQNFIELSKKGYYDGVIFHRVIPDFDDPRRRSNWNRNGWRKYLWRKF